MTLRNSPTRYGSLAKFLHWFIALLFLLEYCSIYFREWFTAKDTPAHDIAFQIHVSVGVGVAMFAILRILWRLNNPPPTPLPGPLWQRRGAGISVLLLYFFMFAMPVSGYLYSKLPIDFFGLYQIAPFAETVLCEWLDSELNWSWQRDIRDPMRTFHREFAGELVLWVLVLIHTVAACYHHFVKCDSTLLRMLPGRSDRLDR